SVVVIAQVHHERGAFPLGERITVHTRANGGRHLSIDGSRRSADRTICACDVAQLGSVVAGLRNFGVFGEGALIGASAWARCVLAGRRHHQNVAATTRAAHAIEVGVGEARDLVRGVVVAGVVTSGSGTRVD